MDSKLQKNTLTSLPQSKKSWTDEQWQSYVGVGAKRAFEGIIEYARRLCKFRDEAESCRGGSNFSAEAERVFGLKKEESSMLVTIGDNAGELFAHANSLANPSKRLMYELVSIDQPVEVTLAEIEKPTVAAVQAYKRRLAAPATARSNAATPAPAPAPTPSTEASTGASDGPRLRELIDKAKAEESGVYLGEASPVVSPADAMNVLGIHPLTKETLKIVARGLQQKYHPDKGGDPKEYEDIIQAITVLEKVT